MPEIDLKEKIISSPEAQNFLRNVTKDFYDRSFLGLWIFEIIGREWDEMREWTEGLINEVNPQTCTWSVPIWEWVYGLKSDETLSLEYRRRLIIAKIRAVRPANPEAIRRGVLAMVDENADVEVNEMTAPFRFAITVHSNGTQVPYTRILSYVRDIKPAHLSLDFIDKFPPMILLNEFSFVFQDFKSALEFVNSEKVRFVGSSIESSFEKNKSVFAPHSFDCSKYVFSNVFNFSATPQFLANFVNKTSLTFVNLGTKLLLQNSYDLSGSVTMDGRWTLNGDFSLNSEKILNYIFKKEAL